MGRRKWLLPSPPTPLQNTTLQSPPSTQTTFPLSPAIPSFSSPTSSSSIYLTTTTTTTTTLTIPPIPQNTTSRNPNSPPLTPPPRLHLRTLLPSPPLPTSYLTTAPETPYPWIWRCHLCHSIYRLGVTRRCLEDGHLFCSVESPPPSPVQPPTTPSNGKGKTVREREGSYDHEKDRGKEGGISKEDQIKSIIERARIAKQKRRKEKKRMAQRSCIAEFDYTGWSAYNGWRRERSVKRAVRMRGQMEVARGVLMRGGGESDAQPSLLGLQQGSTATNLDLTPRDVRAAHRASSNNDKDENYNKEKSKESAPPQQPLFFLRDILGWDGRPAGGRDCWYDCEFPSECHNERKAEREWEARIKAMRKQDQQWRSLVEQEESRKEGEELVGEKGMKGGKADKRRRSGFQVRDSDEIFGESIENSRGRGDGDDDTVMSDVDLDTDTTTDTETDTDMGIESEDDDITWDPYSQTIDSHSSSTSSLPRCISPIKQTPPPLIITSEPNIDFTTLHALGMHLVDSQNLGPLGTDCDGLGEAGYQLNYTQSMRRKSIEDSIGECQPRSPLKTVFGLEDLGSSGT
ncbi:hypothetical protein VTL71DRAFT_2824 [Oculimacula yallundae]|uniref:Uncharacterized protein n=1 Tax=Oculimacula yallundae TaxID=86028 RepID=A0ABR4CB53_9HELO